MTSSGTSIRCSLEKDFVPQSPASNPHGLTLQAWSQYLSAIQLFAHPVWQYTATPKDCQQLTKSVQANCMWTIFKQLTFICMCTPSRHPSCRHSSIEPIGLFASSSAVPSVPLALRVVASLVTVTVLYPARWTPILTVWDRPCQVNLLNDKGVYRQAFTRPQTNHKDVVVHN